MGYQTVNDMQKAKLYQLKEGERFRLNEQEDAPVYVKGDQRTAGFRGRKVFAVYRFSPATGNKSSGLIDARRTVIKIK